MLRCGGEWSGKKRVGREWEECDLLKVILHQRKRIFYKQLVETEPLEGGKGFQELVSL